MKPPRLWQIGVVVARLAAAVHRKAALLSMDRMLAIGGFLTAGAPARVDIGRRILALERERQVGSGRSGQRIGGWRAMSEKTERDRRIVWLQPDGQPVSCEEKLKVLDENLAELRQLCQDAFEDALLMGCEERQVRDVFRKVVDFLRNPYADR